MKLSKHQCHVLKRVQEGWVLGSYMIEIGHTRLNMYGVLQKHGLGHGDPCERVKYVTIKALVKRGFLEKLLNPYPMIENTAYHLTEKGKNWKV